MINSNQSGLSIPKPLELSCLAFEALENVYWPKGENVFSCYWKRFVVNCDTLKHWRLNSYQFVAKSTNRKPERCWCTYKVVKRLSSVASKRSYSCLYLSVPGGCDKWSRVFRFRGQLGVYPAIAAGFRVSRSGHGPAANPSPNINPPRCCQSCSPAPHWAHMRKSKWWWKAARVHNIDSSLIFFCKEILNLSFIHVQRPRSSVPSKFNTIGALSIISQHG